MWQKFEQNQELDTAYALPGVSRFRVNVYRQRGAVGAVMRAIPHKIRSLEELGLPQIVETLAQLPRGLVLVTGPTGSGKSTTLASLLDVANQTRAAHIVTIEDPIEYLHRARQERGEPARGRLRHRRLLGGVEARAASGPRHHPGRRAPGPGDHVGRGDRGRDRPPGAGHPAHPVGRPDRRPADRHLPAAPAAADPGPAGQLPAGRGHPVAGSAQGRHGPDHRLRDHDRQLGHPQPGPRGQGAPDPVVPAGLGRLRA